MTTRQPPRAAWLIVACSAMLSSLPANGADPKAPDPDLPQIPGADLARSLLESPPFTRVLDMSDTLRLTGIAYVQGKPVATIVNKVTKQSYLVAAEPNAMGWRLAEVKVSPEIKRTEVRIMIGSEIIPIHYSDTQLAPDKKAYMPSRIPTSEEVMGHDDKGAYIRGFPYLSDEDRDRFRGSISRETREKFLGIVHDHRETLFKASHEERAAFVKQALDAAEGKR